MAFHLPSVESIKGMSIKKRDGWGSTIGVILAVIGSAVDLGSYLRSPPKGAKYEGSAFLIPYFLTQLLKIKYCDLRSFHSL
jgi:SNF family Na+-dependent transporter